MPELPEVETIAQGLLPRLSGRSVIGVPYIASHLAIGEIHRFGAPVLPGIIGKTIHGVSRRGKLLFLELPRRDVLVFHLRMTGRLGLAPSGRPPGPHVHLLLDLNDGTTLFFQDQRKFGTCGLFSDQQLSQWPFYSNLGPEPLELSPTDFTQRLAGKSGRIKAVLLDQRVIAGIGNIYADESLFRAGIHPATPATLLGPDQLQRLLTSIQDVLDEAITAGGSSIRDYRTAAGLVGTFQNIFQVYGRKGLPCLHCKTPLQTSKIAGRTTCFCPTCQCI